MILDPGNSAIINFTNTGDNTVIAAAAKPIQVIALFLTVAGATTIIFKDGATGLTGAITLGATNPPMLLPCTNMPWFVTTPGNGFVINQSGAVQISGRIYYNVMP